LKLDVGHKLRRTRLADKKQAIDWLERSYQAKETGIIVYIEVNPLLDPVRGDPLRKARESNHSSRR